MKHTGTQHPGDTRRGAATTALLIAGAVGVLALPSAVLAFSSGFAALPQAGRVAAPAAEGFQPVELDSRLARSISVRALNPGKMFRFTPASIPTRPDRLVTVAVRVDGNGARRIAAVTQSRAADPASPGTVLGIAPTAYNLGVARGYKSFGGQSLAQGGELSRIEMPDLASFKPDAGAQGSTSRFSPRIALQERERAGQSPRTFAGDKEDTVDLGGSYRLTRNLNVTAGVRYAQERDRLAPLTDGKQDNQAVYVGTQFRF